MKLGRGAGTATHEVRVMDELEELSDERGEELVVARRVVREREPNRGDDGRAGVARVRV